MSRKYVFEFVGTKKDFLNMLNSYPVYSMYNGEKIYSIDDFFVKVRDDIIHFGVERGDHCGGYWFVPIIAEYDDKVEFYGSVKYIVSDAHRGKVEKIFDKIYEILLYIFLLPLLLFAWLFEIVVWIIRKLIGKPKPESETTIKLYDLMENHLGCTRK